MRDSTGKSASENRLEQWVREHSRQLLGYLLAMVRNRATAEDLLQEVFLRAWQARDRYREDGKARAYLFRIADRLVVDQNRRRKPVELDERGWTRVEPQAPETPPDRLAAEETERRLREALGQLSVPQQRTLLLRYFGALGFDEIAQILDCPLSTVLSHARRGLAALRRLMVEKA